MGLDSQVKFLKLPFGGVEPTGPPHRGRQKPAGRLMALENKDFPSSLKLSFFGLQVFSKLMNSLV